VSEEIVAQDYQRREAGTGHEPTFADAAHFAAKQTFGDSTLVAIK